MAKLSKEQFGVWVEFHGSLYQGFHGWINENLTTINEWYSALSAYAPDALHEASRKHFLRPNADKSTAYSHQLADLLEILREVKAQAEAYRPDVGRYAHVCGMCRNRGLVHVVAKEGEAFLSMGHFPLGYKAEPNERGADQKPLKEISVACKCPAGDKYRARFHTFDAARMELPVAPSREKCESIIAELRSQGRAKEADVYERFLNGRGDVRSIAGTVGRDVPSDPFWDGDSKRLFP